MEDNKPQNPTTKSRVTAYMSKAEKIKWDALCGSVRKSSGTVLCELMNHYGRSYKDKITKEL